LPAEDERVPEWLKPFGGDVLVLLEKDRYVGGVGLKRHDDHVSEISVGTEEAARGRGIARRLVVTAARRILDDGKVPTYLHDLRNHASAKVAEASGFPDRGWRLVVPVP
jgi:predicted GNAT family acetyltransferase